MPATTTTGGAGTGGEGANLRRLSLMSLLAAAAPLVPVPWLDDWAERLVRRRTVADLLRQRGVDPTPADVTVLAGLEAAGRRGCLGWLIWPLTGVAFYAVKKLFRKLLFVLALGDSVRAAATLFEEAYLLRHALALGALPPGPDGRIDRAEARRVRAAMEGAAAATDAAPLVAALRRALAGSGRLLLGEGARLGRWLAGRRRRRGGARGAAAEERIAEELPLEAEERSLGGLADRLAAALGMETAFRRELERRLEERLATPPAGPAAPAPGADMR